MRASATDAMDVRRRGVVRRLTSIGAGALVLLAGLGFELGAQRIVPPGTLPPSPRPVRAVADAPPEDTATTSYTVGGVRVIHRRVTANDVVAANLYLLGGVRQVTDLTAGIEPLLLAVSERGTRKYPRLVLQEKMAALGGAIVVEPSVDWTMIGARSTTDGFDSTFAIMADRVVAPRLDSADVAFVRGQWLSAVTQRRESPDALVAYLADSAAFAGHPYGLSPQGTERSIGAMTTAMLRAYQREQTVTSRILLVIVGNVPRARVERLVKASFGTLPAGAYQWTAPELPGLSAAGSSGGTGAGGSSGNGAASSSGRPVSRGLAISPQQLPTNYLLGYYDGPRAGTADYNALRLAAAALSGRLFTEVRSKRNLTYAVSAPFLDRAVAAGGLYVTTVSPDTVLSLMKTEIERLATELVDPDGLERLVGQFITEYFLDNETNSDQATFLARAQVYRGDYRAAARFVDELRRVTPEDLRRVAGVYMRGVTFAYVGDPGKVSGGRAMGL